MKLRISAQLEYDFGLKTDTLIQIEAAALPDQTILSASIKIPEVEHFVRVSSHDYIGERIWVRKGGILNIDYNSVLDINRPNEDFTKLKAIAPHQLPGETIQYLLNSTYCPASSFQNFVQDEFGHLEGGARIVALHEWISRRVIYTFGSSDNHTNALDTFVERRGVCRDFAHLLISFARASSIPARIASVYAIGVSPQDFHAVAEIYLDGEWHLIDPTNMAKPSEMAIVGIGRDAADVGFLTTYGFGQLNYKNVWVEKV